MTRNTRQEIADRVLARMRERGFTVEQDSAFMNLIDDWTLGLIEMAECRSRYAGNHAGTEAGSPQPSGARGALERLEQYE